MGEQLPAPPPAKFRWTLRANVIYVVAVTLVIALMLWGVWAATQPGEPEQTPRQRCEQALEKDPAAAYGPDCEEWLAGLPQ
jgi:hypothetical protein